MATKETVFKEKVILLLKETFQSAEGHYLDRDTSVFETLDSIDNVEASRKRSKIPETIASHVDHLRFYIVILQKYMNGTLSDDIHWEESWRMKSVNEQEWRLLKKSLVEEFDKLINMIDESDNLDNENVAYGVLNILAHSAYHLGAIRQLISFN